ncbi:MAG: short-chain fatty acyl-CoA regulator family protein [Pseudomonadota bacterium]
MGKAFIGPRLRQLRKENAQTQADMARALDVSPAYINLLEGNQRSLSVKMLVRLSEAYGIDWKDLLTDDGDAAVADLRKLVRDPVFGDDVPDLSELRAAVDHAPSVVQRMIELHRSYRSLLDSVAHRMEEGSIESLLTTSPEAMIHDFFRSHRNYFPALEQAASQMRMVTGLRMENAFVALRDRLQGELGITVQIGKVGQMPDDLRVYDRENKVLLLSEALDHPNRAFQMAHMLALEDYKRPLDQLVASSDLADGRGAKRLRVELANYLAAAALMPYRLFWEAAEELGYDLDLLAARFGVSLEQVAHRLTTLQREGCEGVPFFFLRMDHAGNVTKRFNATGFHLAEHGGACPRLSVHRAFLNRGAFLPQTVELPDGSQFFTLSRTVDRPALGHTKETRHLAIALGCPVDHAHRLVYGQSTTASELTQIGINCPLCPRQRCPQRAHQPLHFELPMSPDRRGGTRYES